jgi:putative transposase
MSTKYRSDGPDRIFHISARVNWRVWYLEDEESKEKLSAFISEAACAFGVRVLAGVIMSNHVHLVLQSPPPPLYRTLTGRRLPCRHFRPWPAGHPNSSVIAQFMRHVRRKMTNHWKRKLDLTGRFWESAYDARAIGGPCSLATRVAYDHHNPVRERMCRRAEDYAWSSARQWLTGEAGRFPIQPGPEEFFGMNREEFRTEVLEIQRRAVSKDFGEAAAQLMWRNEVDNEDDWENLLAEHGLAPGLRHGVRNVEP